MKVIPLREWKRVTSDPVRKLWLEYQLCTAAGVELARVWRDPATKIWCEQHNLPFGTQRFPADFVPDTYNTRKYAQLIAERHLGVWSVEEDGGLVEVQ